MFSVDLINGRLVGVSPTKYVVLRRPSTVVFSQEAFDSACPANLDTLIGRHWMSRQNGEIEISSAMADSLFDAAISNLCR